VFLLPVFANRAASELELRRETATAREQPPGQVVYNRHCVSCHGETGTGEGPAAYLLYPKPRDFTAGLFRFKSTLDAQPPTRADLWRVIREGVQRTAMPSFKGVLTKNEIREVAEYVRVLSGFGKEGEELSPIEIPARPEFTPDLIKQGRLVYEATDCASCHGAGGRGDGPSSYSLKDSDGYPLPPADFTTGRFKAGDAPEDLYRTFIVGVPGTPMPSFDGVKEALRHADVEGLDDDVDPVWALVAYLQSLLESKEPPGIRSGGEIAVVESNDAAILRDPFYPAWANVPFTDVSLQPLWQRKRTVRSVRLRAVQVGDRLAWFWNGRTPRSMRPPAARTRLQIPSPSCSRWAQTRPPWRWAVPRKKRPP